MSCKHCCNEERVQAKMELESCISRESYTEDVPAHIYMGGAEPQLVLGRFYGVENAGDAVSDISLEIKFCPFCGEKLA